MKVSVEEIVIKYKQNLFGKDVVYFCAKRPKYLIICFTAMHIDRFDRISWFYNNAEWEDTCYLFLQDNSFHYYLGTDTEDDFSIYRKIIEYFFKQDQFLRKNTFTLGSSMGGYAALYYSIVFKLGGAVTAVPQLDKESVALHNFANWKKSIAECGSKWVDIVTLVIENEKLPFVYIEYGNYIADKYAATKLINALIEKKSLYISRKIEGDEHNMLFEKENILVVLDFFKNFSI